jgi:hypothetical protein
MTSMTSTTDSTNTCPTWCTEHRDLSGEREPVHEHRSRVFGSTALAWGQGKPADPAVGAAVYVSQYEREQEPEPARIVMVTASDALGQTQLESSWARDLADNLLEAADLLDGQGRTNSTRECDRG